MARLPAPAFFSGADAYVNNKELKEVAKNLTGLYFLYPDRRYISLLGWLRISGYSKDFPPGADLNEAGILTGDGTVPLFSATAGPGHSAVPIHYVCDVGHVELPANPQVTARIRGFLINGSPIPASAVRCPKPK